MIEVARVWTGRHRAEIALSLRITVAALIAFGLGELLGIRQVYWAVLTSAIVMQASVGGSLKATLDRLAGTVIGAVWGVIVAGLVRHQTALPTAAGLVAALVPLALLTALRPSYRVAPVTAIIVLLVPHGDSGPLPAAFERVVEIALGCAVALGVALAFKPARAHWILQAATAEALAPVGQQLVLLLGGVAALVDREAVLALHDRIRGAVERCAVAAGEAEQERRSYLSDAPDPDPMVRSLRRVSHDLVILARALSVPLPQPVGDRLAAPARSFAAAVDAFLARLAEALRQELPPPPVAEVKTALAGLDEAIAALRRDRVIVPLSAEDAERVFGAAFALQQLAGNLEDLANRAAEAAPAPARAPV